MFRDLEAKLIAWKAAPTRKPLVVLGMRQCGKTYSLTEFGRTQYENLVYINFESDKEVKSIFEKNLDVRRILIELSAFLEVQIIAGETLLFFDEIQACAGALSSLKYFYENAPEYHIVSAGSLLGVKVREGTSFPVGKVNLIHCYPLSFREFLIASDKETLLNYFDNVKVGEEISEALAAKIQEQYQYFLITGGMPEVVASWVRTASFQVVDDVQQSILDSYEFDFAKHAGKASFDKLVAIWRSIPAQLGKENTKFIFSKIPGSFRASQLDKELEWLTAASMILQVPMASAPNIPLSSVADFSNYKVYLSDVGLLRKLAGLTPKQMMLQDEAYRFFKGSLVENFVATELIKYEKVRELYFWKSGNLAEVDFLAQIRDDIVPVEVKSGKKVRGRSLTIFRDRFKPQRSLQLSVNNVYSHRDDLDKVPNYMLWKV